MSIDLSTQGSSELLTATASDGSVKLWLGFAAILLVVEGYLLYQFHYHHFPALLLLFAHVALLLPLVRFTHQMNDYESDLRLPVFLLLLTAIAGPIGAGLFFIFIPAYYLLHLSKHDVAATLQVITPQVIRNPADDLHRDIQLGKSTAVWPEKINPLHDIITAGSNAEKFTAIAHIANDFNPAYIPALHALLNDNNNHIRTQAAAVLSANTQNLKQRIFDFKHSLAKHPDNIAFVKQTADYFSLNAHNHLLDRNLRQDLREQAIALYQHYQTLAATDTAAAFALCQTYLAANQAQQAHAWLRQQSETRQCTAEQCLAYMQCLYQLEEFSTLRQYAQTQQTLPREVVALWL